MLTWSELEQHRSNGLIERWLGGLREVPPEGRALYMMSDVYTQFQELPWPATRSQSPFEIKRRRTQMKAVMKRFVSGATLISAIEIKEMGSEYVDNRMRGFWEFRSGPPGEQLRLFGVFARPGAFIATSFRSRGEMEADPGEAPQSRWLAEHEAAKEKWNVLTANKNYMTEPWPVVSKNELRPYMERSDD